MALVSVLLPPLRVLTRISPRNGAPLLGAVLLRCVTPRWVWWREKPLELRLAQGEETVALFRLLVALRPAGPRHQYGLARALHAYAGLLGEARRHEEACAAADEFLSLTRDRLGTRTASALCLRAGSLAELGRLDEALAAAQESVAAYRSAPPRHGDRAPGSLLGALRMQAFVLGRCSRPAESVAVYVECVKLLDAMNVWQLFHAQTVQARVLMEVTGQLRVLGRYREALRAGEEARESVVGMTPRLHPEMVWRRARLQIDLAWCYGAIGELRRACDNAEEAVAAFRAQAEHEPDTGNPRLVLALQCLAHQLGELDVRAGEQAALRELADLCTRLAQTSPETYEPQLAEVLARLAVLHWAAGARNLSVQAERRTVDTLRRMAKRQPDVMEPQLARALVRLAARRFGAGRWQGAAVSGAEALAVTQRLAESDADASVPLIAESIRMLTRMRRRATDEAEAFTSYAEAETLLHGLMDARDPAPHEALLAAPVAELARVLRATAEERLDEGRVDDAVTALRILLALSRRTRQSDVQAACASAFARARAQELGPVLDSWERATADPFPTFVYRRP